MNSTKSLPRIAIVGRAALALFLLTACGGARSSPEGSVTAFLDALDERDSVAFASSFTPGTRDLVVELEALTRTVGAATQQPAITLEDWCNAFCGATVEGSTLHGDSATVRVRMGNTVEEILVVRLDDEWRIDLEERYRPAVEMLRMIATQEAQAGTAGPDTLP